MDSCQLIQKETKIGVVHINQKQLAARWRISEASLERWRSEGIGPKFLKLCGRVLYRQVDTEAYEESCLATSTRTVAAQTGVGFPCQSGNIRRSRPAATSSAAISPGIKATPKSSVAKRRNIPTLLTSNRPHTFTSTASGPRYRVHLPALGKPTHSCCARSAGCFGSPQSPR